MNEGLKMLARKTYSGAYHRLVGVVSVTQMTATIYSQTEPFVEEISTIHHEPAARILQLKGHRKSGFGAGDGLVQIQPGITGEEFPFGRLPFAGISAALGCRA